MSPQRLIYPSKTFMSFDQIKEPVEEYHQLFNLEQYAFFGMLYETVTYNTLERLNLVIIQSSPCNNVE